MNLFGESKENYSFFLKSLINDQRLIITSLEKEYFK